MASAVRRCCCGAALLPRTPLARRSLSLTPRFDQDTTVTSPRARPPRAAFLDGASQFAHMDGETPYQRQQRERRQTWLLYSFSGGLLFLGLCYAAVPLYRLFCAKTGYGGTAAVDPGGTHAGQFAPDRLVAATGKKARQIKVRFLTDCADALPWKFAASQSQVTVVPGETALAFFTAKNTTDKDIIGVATYTVLPGQIAPYFAKVECFCFDEQRLLANEEVDLPVLFFIDRDFLDDPAMKDIDDVTLNYTFFRARRNDRGVLVPEADEATLKQYGFQT